MPLYLEILFILFLLYVAICLVVYRVQEKRIFQPSPLDKEQDLGLDPPHRERWFEVERGLSLNAAHLKVEDPKGLILYHHGNSGNLSEWKDVASLFLPHGFDVLVYDYRGYGKSQGQIKSERELFSDGQFVYDAMKAEYGEERILLYGRSLGSGIASWLATENDPAMLLLETPFYSMKELVFEYYPWLPNFLLLKYPLRNDLYLQELSCPVHIFHGDQDKVVYYRSSQKLKRFLRSEDRFHRIEGGHHADLSEFEEFHKALKEALSVYEEHSVQDGKVRSAS